MAFLDDIPLLKKMIDLGSTLVLVVVLSVLVGLIFAFPVMWLWNFIFIPMSESMRINVFQAWALNILAGILFGQRGNKNP